MIVPLRPPCGLAGGAACGADFCPSFDSVPLNSRRMLAAWRQTSSRLITVIGSTIGDMPQFSSWKNGAKAAATTAASDE